MNAPSCSVIDNHYNIIEMYVMSIHVINLYFWGHGSLRHLMELLTHYCAKKYLLSARRDLSPALAVTFDGKIIL